MEKLSRRIADLLLRKNYIEETMYSVYQYGMQMALEVGCSFITSIIICCLLGKVVEGIIFFAVFIPLRSYLGGFHLKTYGACYVCSCVTLVAALGVSVFEPVYYISWFILCFSIITVFLAARRGKLRDAEGRHFYTRICVVILVILIMGIIFTALGSSSKLFLLAYTNILVAVSKLLERKQAIEDN